MADAVTVDTLHEGDHACLTYSDADERLDIVAAFVADGLERNQKVICFTDTVSPGRLPTELGQRQVAALEPLRRGQLAILGSARSWLASGPPSATSMVDVLAAELDRAAEQGYAGLRVTADMSWATRPVASVEQLLEFESAAARLFTDGRLTVICEYDRDSFDPVTLAFAADAHPKTVAATAYHDDAVLRICRQHRPPGIRIAGEVDYTRLEPLQQALAEALRLDEDIHVNLTRLRFIDVTATAAIAQAALTLPGHREMIVSCDPSVAEMFAMVGGDEAPQLRVQRAHGGS